ncbi:MAG: aminopeptidase [Candidatus Cloacimonas sp.]|jgi:leucyl aminopeptidase (aminopeptidase T)|nr:aminopeptidase [Candidatus Cloacimonas sp.]HNX02795.1 aminopeptidase [Candidatus Cloacimonas sp.]HPS61103.1 aminopeptidase [Candidatus Cloacimonas sp.]
MKATFNDVKVRILACKEPYQELIQRLEIMEIKQDMPDAAFFQELQKICLQSEEFATFLEDDPQLKTIPLEHLSSWHNEYYAALANYDNCLGNPDYAVKQYGEEKGRFIASVYYQFMNMFALQANRNYLQLEENLRLFYALYNKAVNGIIEVKDWIQDYRKLFLENYKTKLYYKFYQNFYPEANINYDLILNSNLKDLRYLYRYGMFISDASIKMAQFLNSYPEQELMDIARYIVQCWIDGFTRGQKDYRQKKTAAIIVPCGMELLGRLVYNELEKIGIKGQFNVPYKIYQNKQFSYDHRFDNALILDTDFADMAIEVYAEVVMELQEELKNDAGPVYIELFGETPFSPIVKNSVLTLSKEQQDLSRKMISRNTRTYYQYYKRDQASFCIIAFPSPEIGEQFPEIFAATLKINLLDSMHYAEIQQKIIDVLDKADYVNVKGKPGNDTDINVQLHTLQNPDKETNFENCVADVNIPVGEVFTSPVLKGTNGTLHVADIYLNSLRYFNLKIHFADGWVKDYSCTNFADPEEGEKYIYENLLLPHKSLPIGEFAIGTNTLAYQMAKKYDILALLPILIIEKMGPHFAIGDTCYSNEEDSPHPSFVNGKEMIAVDNEKSITRKEDPVNAYLQKHIDITLPYEMLASITAVTKEGEKFDIIRDGRFVVPGTEELNIYLDEGV